LNGGKKVAITVRGLQIGEVPRIVGVVTEPHIPDLIKARKHGADLVELRGDFFGDGIQGEFHRDDFEEISNRITRMGNEAAHLDLPTVLAIRSVDCGGNLKITEEDRFDLFERTMVAVDIIDVELGSEIREGIIDLVHGNGRPVILSYFDIFNTPNLDTLNSLLESAGRSQGDIIKIAVHSDSEADVVDLFKAFLRFREAFPDKPIAAISMGIHGVLSRFVFPLYGSCLSYGYVTEPSAPGMPKLAILREVMNSLGSKKKEARNVVDNWLQSRRLISANAI